MFLLRLHVWRSTYFLNTVLITNSFGALILLRRWLRKFMILIFRLISPQGRERWRLLELVDLRNLNVLGYNI